MSETTRRFFDRFDLEHDQEVDHWFVEIRGGAVRVLERDGNADAARHPRDVVGDRRGRG